MNRLEKELDMLVTGADFLQAAKSLMAAKLELQQAIIQQLKDTTQYNVIIPITDKVKNDNLFN